MPRFAFLPAHSGAAVLAILLPLAAHAAPVDPVVRAGTATFAINGNTYTVTNTPNTIIDWRQFNVANGELLRFLQQNPQSVVLNRVTGTDPSQLFGLLQSNGRVVLINPNGILFGPNASVDVAGLIASTLNLSDADFLAGRMAFNGGGGLLQNQGRITTPLGGSVMLVGGDVTNSGVITAPGGRILLAAGQSVSLADTGTPGLSVTLKADGNKALNLGELHAQGGSIDLYGALVEHSGIARADSAAIDAHGNIVLKASADTTVSGTVSAAGAAGSGGTVQVLGENVTLAGSARIDVSGRQGGGTVLVGGDLQGANPAVQNARTAAVAAGAQIDASATGNGDGGKVVVWSNDKTDYAGTILARGGALGGNGGQVETSGKQLSFDKGAVNTLAPKGRTGNWLLDPAVFCFYVSSSSECTGAAAAGATDFNTLGNILVSTGGTLQATDFVTFLPAGGNAAVSNSVPAGLTLNVKAPYIQLGNGSNIDTKAVGVRLDASNAYGTTTQTDAAGTSLTGTIAIGGQLTSNASQTLISTGNIALADGGARFTALRMTSATGTQSLSTAGQLLLAAGSGNDAAGQPRQTALFSDGAQTINAGQLILRAGNAAGAAGNHVEISAKGSQSITATDVTLDARASGWAIISDNAAGAAQTIKADRIALTGGAAGTDNRAVIIASGDNSVQDITAKTSLDVTGGAGGVRNLAIIKSEGGSSAAASTQTVTAGALKVTGGGGANDNYATIYTPGTQSISAASIAIAGGNSGTATTGAAPYAAISSDTGQAIKATGAVTLVGGAGNLGSAASLYSGGSQAISAGSLLVQGGAAGKGNNANISFGENGNATQSITVASLTMQGGGGTDNFAGIHGDGAHITQNVTATSLTIKGGGGTTSGNWAHLWFNDTTGANGGKQTITVGTAALTGGSGGTDQNAMIGGNADQRITADAITLTGGAGVGAGATISTEGNHTAVVKNGLVMTGGSNNNAEARLGGSGTADITADSITLQGGSAGTRAIAEINGAKNVTINVNGAFTMTGGTGGTDNNASAASSANLAINAGTLAMAAGSTGSGNGASLNSGAAMAVKVRNTMTLTAGAEGTGNSATLGSAGNQTLEAASLSITGGSGGSANHANISINGGTDAVQKVTAATVTMLGGQGGSNNIAGLHANGTRVTQEINANVLSLTGGKGTGNWAHIASGYNDTTPSAQRFNVGSLAVTGGSSGAATDSGNDATILGYGTQAIKGNSMTLTGGTGQRASAHVSNTGAGGLQSVELTGALTVTGGAGTNSGARLIAESAQSVTADSITLLGGTGSGNQAASILSVGGKSEAQTVTTNKLTMTGGGGYDGSAYLYQSSGGLQKVIITGGGSISMSGGSGAIMSAAAPGDYCAGCQLSSNVVSLFAVNQSSQTIDFVAGGKLTLKGGTNGASNAAVIAVEPGTNVKQTITSSGGAANYPVISLTGGAGGFYNRADGAEAGNIAAIGSLDSLTAATGMTKTINAKSITLAGGGTNERGNAVLATGQGDAVINVTGDLTMTGGASSQPYQKPANAATAYMPDLGSFAGIYNKGSVDLKVGGNLVIKGGTGTSSPAGILIGAGSGNTLKVDVHGATRMDAGASLAALATQVSNSEDELSGGVAVVSLTNADSFTTGTFASSSKWFELDGVINATGSAADATLVGNYGSGSASGASWRALGAKPLQVEIYASDKFELSSGSINTPNGSWIVTLGKNAASTVPGTVKAFDYAALGTHGYQWTSATYNSSNAQEFRFILPDNAPIVETHADEVIAQTACASNPALCVTQPVAAATPASAVAPVVIDVKLTGGVDETPLSASLAQNKAETPAAAPEAAPAPKVQGPRVAARETEAARADEQKKSTADLKREARDAVVQAKVIQEAARKAVLAAQKEALEAKRIAAAAAKTEAQAARATAAVGAAEGDLRAAEADARDARAALGTATTPALKNQAQLRLATAEAARAGAEAKLADARAKRAELGAQGSEAGARSAQADAVALDARSREAAAEAKLAELAHKEALLRAREAKDPVSRAAAERLADDKRVEATQRAAESDVRKSIADDLRFASEQAKAQADARQAQAQAAQALAQARRDEVRLQRAVARARQEEVLADKRAAGRTAQGGKDAAEKLVAAESKRAEASQAAANAKAQAAEARQRKADEGMAQVARRDDVRRERAVKAFVAGANASMTASQLAQLAALRHEYKGLLFKDALKVLEQNGRAADLPACGGNISNTCMPSFAQARMEWPTARPLVRKPVAAYLPQIERKVAIVIGINDYADKRIPRLEAAVPDADAVAQQLETSMGYETRVLRNATKGDIVAALQNVARELDPNDSLVVYYAGHGYLRTVPKGPAQGYWIPSDGAVSNPANWISNADVSKLLANIPAKQVMLVSDSCYSGAFSREQKVAAAGDASAILARRSVVVMSSGGEEPVSDEGVDGHSIFAWSLMQSMKKVGQVEPGSRVFDATREQVTAAYPQVPQYGAAVSAGHAQGGDYLFEARTYK